MSRKKPQSDDSLELLLDTICNVFGGIIFIAMLVAILTEASGGGAEGAAPAEDDVVQVSDWLEAQQELERFRAAHQAAAESVAVLGSDESAAALAEIEAIEQAVEAARHRLANLEAWQAEFDEVVTRQQDQLADQLATAQSQLSRLRRDMQAMEQDEIQELRLPLARETNKRQIIVMLHGNRVYAVPIGSGATLLRAFNDDVTIHQLPLGQRVEPNANGGARVDAGFEQSPWFRQMVSHLNPRQYFVDIYAYPDSTAAFQGFRAAILKQGFEYGLHPIPGERPLVFHTSFEPGQVQ